jgi:radical SAM superfamily enzyme YgiQ (UPF0313 family)
MKIQLVNPHNKENMYAAPKFFRYADKVSKGLNFNAMGALFPSLNLSSLAAVTQTEHEVAIDDGCLGPVTAQCSADLVGITAMTSQAPAAYALADQYRARGIPVVIGGIHASMCPDEAAEHADTVVIGEADRLWPELIQDFAAGTLKSSYRDSAAVDLAEIPIPRRDLLDRRGYVAFNSVETSRGCPFNCNFCSVTRMSGIKYRFRPIAKVIEEVRGLSGRTVFFVDDNIIGVPRRAKELFRALTPLNRRWASQVTINFAHDEELMRLARESGCEGVFIGFETLSRTSVQEAGKGVNKPDEYLRDIRRIRKAGIRVVGSFILGFENDDLSVFQDTLNFLDQAQMDFAQFSLLTPLPGTVLFEKFDQEARIIHRDWSKYDLGDVVFTHPLLTAKRLHFEKNHAYRRFYSIRSMIKRLGLPRNRGDLLVWIINLAFRGFLTNRWGNEYWRWKEKESDKVDASPALSMPDLRKIEENKGLVEQQP